MVEAYVKNALFNVLNGYLHGLDKDQINFSFMSGKGAVRGVKVNVEKMNTFLGNVGILPAPPLASPVMKRESAVPRPS